MVCAADLPDILVVPLEKVSYFPISKGRGVFVTRGGFQAHLLSSGALHHHRIGSPAPIQRERGAGRSGEGQRSRRKGAGRVEIRTGRGGLAVVVNFADLKVDIVTLRILGVDYDAGHGVAGQVVSGGEGLSAISGRAGTVIVGPLRIADQGGRRRVDQRGRGAEQYLAAAGVVHKSDLDPDLLPKFTLGQRVGARVHADVGLKGDPVGVVPLPLIGERTGQAVDIIDAGGRGGQGLRHLCDAGDVRRTRRRIGHRVNVDRHGVFGEAVRHSVVDLESEARVDRPVGIGVGGWGVHHAQGQLGRGNRLRQLIRGDRRAAHHQRAPALHGQPGDFYARQRVAFAIGVAETDGRECVDGVFFHGHRAVHRRGRHIYLEYRGECVDAESAVRMVGCVSIDCRSYLVAASVRNEVPASKGAEARRSGRK